MQMSGRKLKMKISGLLGLGLVLVALPAAQASVIWNTPQNISAPTDVQTNGSLVYAFGFAGTAETVNGITFATFPTPGTSTSVTNGNLTLSTTGANNITNFAAFGAAAPLTGSYAALMNAGDYAFASGATAQPLDVTLGGLTSGMTYQVEIWVNDARTGFTTRSETAGPTTLEFQVPATGNGQFETGTFTATGTSQTFVLQGTDGSHPMSASQLNAIELLQTSSVPEPATFGITGGLLALSSLLLRRRSRATSKS